MKQKKEGLIQKILHLVQSADVVFQQGTELREKAGTKSLKGIKKTLFTKAARWVFEMDVVESTDDKLFLDFHYCPLLVKAWQKAGCTDAEIA